MQLYHQNLSRTDDIYFYLARLDPNNFWLYLTVVFENFQIYFMELGSNKACFHIILSLLKYYFVL